MENAPVVVNYADLYVQARKLLSLLLGQVESLNGYELTKDTDRYKAQACWDDSIRVCQDFLSITESPNQTQEHWNNVVGGAQKISAPISHETDPHCCGCWVISYDDDGLTAKCNECGETHDLVPMLSSLHSQEEDFQHFLSYSNLSKESEDTVQKLRMAFDAASHNNYPV